MMRKNIVASVLARLRNVAKKRNVIFGEILLRYAVERVLKRIEESEYASQCILKGFWMARFQESRFIQRKR